MFAEISFPIPINKTFHYKVPSAFENQVSVGDLVKCHFKCSVMNGTIISLSQTLPEELPLEKVKEIDSFVPLRNMYDFDCLKNVVEYCFSKWHSPKGMYYGLFYENIFDVLSNCKVLLPNNIEKVKLDFFPDRVGESAFWRDEFPLSIIASQIATRKVCALFLCPHYLSALFVYRKISSIFNAQECAFYHGYLTKQAKRKILAQIISGKVKYIVGTKAAIFLPYPKGTLISVLGSENNLYFQLEQRPFYKTCDLVQKIAFEFSHRAAFFSCYTGLEIPKKPNSLSKSSADVDFLVVKAAENFSVISQKSIEETQKAISNGEKVLYLASSRGVAFKSFCLVCKWTAKCEKCMKNLRLFSKDGAYFYVCPSCMKKTSYLNKCPNCSSEILKTGGHGSQKIAQQLQELFPQAKIFRIDADSVKKSLKAAENIYCRLSNLDYDVIVGTSLILDSQIYEKKFSLAVLSSLYTGVKFGFRESERLFSKILSASSVLKKKGLLIAETFEPDNSIFSFGIDSEKFSQNELETRKFFIYPPFCDLFTVRISCKEKAKLKAAAKSFISMFTQERIKQLDIIEYKPKETVKRNKQTKLSYHDTFFKVKKDSNAFSHFLSSIDFGKDIEISIWPEWFF